MAEEGPMIKPVHGGKFKYILYIIFVFFFVNNFVGKNFKICFFLWNLFEYSDTQSVIMVFENVNNASKNAACGLLCFKWLFHY